MNYRNSLSLAAYLNSLGQKRLMTDKVPKIDNNGNGTTANRKHDKFKSHLCTTITTHTHPRPRWSSNIKA